MKLKYTARAALDVELAVAWYEKQRRGLGFEFLDCMEISIQNIIHSPEMYQICYSRFRRCLIRKFPFSVFYTIEQDSIIIHSVFDNRQDPVKRP